MARCYASAAASRWHGRLVTRDGGISPLGASRVAAQVIARCGPASSCGCWGWLWNPEVRARIDLTVHCLHRTDHPRTAPPRKRPGTPQSGSQIPRPKWQEAGRPHPTVAWWARGVARNSTGPSHSGRCGEGIIAQSHARKYLCQATASRFDDRLKITL